MRALRYLRGELIRKRRGKLQRSVVNVRGRVEYSGWWIVDAVMVADCVLTRG